MLMDLEIGMLMVSMHRDNDLPAFEMFHWAKEWYVDGLLHRDKDLPAVEKYDRVKMWYINGKLHRKGGRPAYE